jgi:hypothetical protein
MTMQQIVGSANVDRVMNENFETLEHQSVYGLDPRTTDALTWSYYGGIWGGVTVAAGTLTLTNAATNYVVVNRTTGAISVSTSATNWNTAGTYARVYKLTTAGGVVTAVEDHRAGPGGVHGSGAPGSGASTAGRHMIYVSAAAMRPSVTGGCADLAAIASAANQPDIVTLNFDSTTKEYAQFSISMPKSWNEGTISAAFIWSHASGGASHGLAWSLQAVAVSNDDAIATNFGTAQLSIDTGGTANDVYVSPETSAITVGGTPQAEDVVFFRVALETDDSSHTINIDARLHGIQLFIVTDADTDA